MKTTILRSTLLFGLCALLSTASCTESNPTEDPGDKPDDKTLTAIEIDPDKIDLETGGTFNLKAFPTPTTASVEGVRWSSKDNAIATVSETGVVTATGAGVTTINAALSSIKGSCTVTVTKKPVALQKIEVTPASLKLKMGATATLTTKFIPTDTSVEGKVSWASSNPSVATVDADGKVTPVSNGTAEIIATLGTISGKSTIEVYTHAAARTFTFYQLNLWEGLVNITGGKTAGIKAFVDQLVEIKPDVASFCEFPSGSSADEILTAAIKGMKERTGIQYYYNQRGGSGTRGLLTRHPILSTSDVPSKSGNSLWFYRTVIDYYGQEMAIYASHAKHDYYSCYLPRGYGDGSTNAQMGIYGWAKLEGGPITDVNFMLKQEDTSTRTQIGIDLVADATSEHNKGRLAIFGGDLNQPSHLDWTEATKNSYEHNGCVVPWTISTLCYAGGLKDAFREIYPNPVTHPGVSWPVSNKDGLKVTQWAAEADERDRIDYVYYYPNAKLAPKKAQMVGPTAMISKSQIVEDTFVNKAEELIEPTNGIWPTDHRGLLITFEIKFPS